VVVLALVYGRLRGEGLVIKHPSAQYILNGRNEDWFKVKPEYLVRIFLPEADCFIDYNTRITWVKLLMFS
jgi:ATP-dependent DNA ligase